MDEMIDLLVEVLAPFSPRNIAARLRHDLSAWCDIRVTSPLAVLAGLNCLGALIVIKSQEPGSTFRLSDSRMCLAAAAAAGLAIASRWALFQCQRERPAFWIRVLLSAFSVLPLAALFVAATPRNSLLAVAFVSALAVLAGNANLLWKRKPESDSADDLSSNRNHHGVVAPREWSTAESPMSIADHFARPAVIGGASLHRDRPALVQPEFSAEKPRNPAEAIEPARHRATEWCERSTDSAGSAVMQGTIMAHFSAGQSLTTAHIPFLPPFDRTPEFTCEAADAPSVRVRTPAVFRYGARLELKRTGDVSQAASIPVQYHVVAREATRRAA